MPPNYTASCSSILRTSRLRRSGKFAAYGSPLWPEGGGHGILPPAHLTTGHSTQEETSVENERGSTHERSFGQGTDGAQDSPEKHRGRGLQAEAHRGPEG